MNPSLIYHVTSSLDGYIAGPNGELDWLHATPNPDGIDMGFGALMEEVDAIVMGRGTFEVVCGFEGPWPYTKPIYVLSNTLTVLPEKAQGKATLLKGELEEVLAFMFGRVAALGVDGAADWFYKNVFHLRINDFNVLAELVSWKTEGGKPVGEVVVPFRGDPMDPHQNKITGNIRTTREATSLKFFEVGVQLVEGRE